VNLPPLVEPAASLSVQEVRRYSRHLIIPDVAMDGQKRLKNARVLCVGAGGLGSPALMYLAAAGVGTLGIIDFDVVDESNLQRQIIHGQSDLGRPKAESARDSVREINPLISVNVYNEQLSNENVLEIFSQYDLILDGTDNFATRYMVNDAVCCSASRTCGARSTVLTGRSACSGMSTGPTTATYTRTRRPRAWSRRVPKAASSACSARPSARSWSPRRSSSSPGSATLCSVGCLCSTRWR
jgi:hypothetical protein